VRRALGSLMKISADDLVRGGWYALEQGGHLLNDAVELFDLRRDATAVALAMLGREEVGKAQILFRLADEAASGREVDVAEIETTDHVAKQKAGYLSTTLRSSGPENALGSSSGACSRPRRGRPSSRRSTKNRTRSCDGSRSRPPTPGIEHG